MSSLDLKEIDFYKQRLQKYSKFLVGPMSNSLSRRKKDQLCINLLNDFELLMVAFVKPRDCSYLKEKITNPMVEVSSTSLESNFEEITFMKTMNTSLFNELLSIQEKLNVQSKEFNSLRVNCINLEVDKKKIFENLSYLQDYVEKKSTLIFDNTVHTENSVKEEKQHQLIKKYDSKSSDSAVIFNELLVLQESYGDMENKASYLESDIKRIKNENKSLFEQLLFLQNSFRDNAVSDSSIKSREYITQNKSLNSKVGGQVLVKSSLSYRLGNQIVSGMKSKNYSKVFKRILTTSVQHYHEVIKEELSVLDNLNDYVDRQEADKAKQHLSFVVGRAILSNISSKSGLKKIPQELIEEFVIYRRAQKSLEK